MTLDLVLPRLKKGYDLQVVEYPRWKTLIARRQWMPNGIDPKAAAERAESMRQGTQPDGVAREDRGAQAGKRVAVKPAAPTHDGPTPTCRQRCARAS